MFAKLIQVGKLLYCELVPSSLRPRLFRPKKLEEAISLHKQWLETVGTEQAQGKRLVVRHGGLRHIDLRNADLSQAVLFDCDLRGAILAPEAPMHGEESAGARLTGADLRYSRFEGALLAPPNDPGGRVYSGVDVSNANFVGASGLFGSDAAFTGQGLVFDPGEPPIVQRWGHPSSMGDFPPWEAMKVLGTLPILSISNVFFTLILAYAALAKWYNQQIDSLREVANSGLADQNVALLAGIMKPAPAPAHLGNLLLVFVCLSIANILYRTLCPTVVQEYSRYSVFGRGYDHGQRLTYLSATYSTPLVRILCFLLLTSSGGYLVLYLVRRIAEALEFFFPQMVMW